jgi:hypothetical protein
MSFDIWAYGGSIPVKIDIVGTVLRIESDRSMGFAVGSLVNVSLESTVDDAFIYFILSVIQKLIDVQSGDQVQIIGYSCHVLQSTEERCQN